LTGSRPWELLHKSPLEVDFNNAVMWPLYELEREREGREREALATLIGREVALQVTRMFQPVFGYELREPVEPRPVERRTVTITVDGQPPVVPEPPPGCHYDSRGSLIGRPCHGEHVFVDGECRGCGLRNENGVLRYGTDTPECDAHEIENGVCRKCGGREIAQGTGWVTKPTPRILGACEHKNFAPFRGQLKCKDCGSAGM
jgi:hypothetical protein